MTTTSSLRVSTTAWVREGEGVRGPVGLEAVRFAVLEPNLPQDEREVGIHHEEGPFLRELGALFS